MALLFIFNVYDLHTAYSLINLLYSIFFSLIMLLALNCLLIDISIAIHASFFLFFSLYLPNICLPSLNFQSFFVTLFRCVSRNTSCLGLMSYLTSGSLSFERRIQFIVITMLDVLAFYDSCIFLFAILCCSFSALLCLISTSLLHG